MPPAAAPAPGPPAVPAGLALFSAAVPAGNAAGAETAGAGPGAEAAEPGAASGSAPEPLQLIGPVEEAANRAASASAHVTHTPRVTSHAPRFAPPSPCLLSSSVSCLLVVYQPVRCLRQAVSHAAILLSLFARMGTVKV